MVVVQALGSGCINEDFMQELREKLVIVGTVGWWEYLPGIVVGFPSVEC